MMTTCQHARYSYVLLHTTRHCICETCEHQWMVMLGGGNKRGEAVTDDIRNEVGGLEFAEQMRRRAVRMKTFRELS